MKCVNGWEDCSMCAFEQKCIAGMFTPEEDRAPIIKAAEIAEASTQAEAVEGAKRLRGEIRLESFWKEWGKYRSPNLHSKEPMPAGQGAPGGGGSSGKIKKDTKGNKKPVYEWGCFK